MLQTGIPGAGVPLPAGAGGNQVPIGSGGGQPGQDEYGSGP